MRGDAPGHTARDIELTIDGDALRVPEGTTILEACRRQDIDIPTLCYLENLTPVNVCRVCVVELEGSRIAGTRLFAAGRVGHGRADHSRASA